MLVYEQLSDTETLIYIENESDLRTVETEHGDRASLRMFRTRPGTAGLEALAWVADAAQFTKMICAGLDEAHDAYYVGADQILARNALLARFPGKTLAEISALADELAEQNDHGLLNIFEDSGGPAAEGVEVPGYYVYDDHDCLLDDEQIAAGLYTFFDGNENATYHLAAVVDTSGED